MSSELILEPKVEEGIHLCHCNLSQYYNVFIVFLFFFSFMLKETYLTPNLCPVLCVLSIAASVSGFNFSPQLFHHTPASRDVT